MHWSNFDPFIGRVRNRRRLKEANDKLASVKVVAATYSSNSGTSRLTQTRFPDATVLSASGARSTSSPQLA